MKADIIYTLLLPRLVFEAPVGITPALHINARMHLNIAKVRAVGLKSYIIQHLNSRAPSLCVLSFLFPFFFTAQNAVSRLIKKHHSSHLARIQLRDMALKAQP